MAKQRTVHDFVGNFRSAMDVGGTTGAAPAIGIAAAAGREAEADA
jgi:hypothetical protein